MEDAVSILKLQNLRIAILLSDRRKSFNHELTLRETNQTKIGVSPSIGEVDNLVESNFKINTN